MKRPPLTYAICPLCLVLLAACQKDGNPEAPEHYAGGGVGSYSWSNAIENPVAGIDYGQLWCHWVGGKPGILIWADVEGGGTSSRSSGSADGATFGGSFYRIPIKFRGRILHSKDGTLSIAGIDYSLERGSLFLVSSKGGNPLVMQLARNVAELDLLSTDASGESDIDKSKLRSLGRADPEIAAFFGVPTGQARNP